MENKEKFKNFIIEHLGECLIELKRTTPRESTTWGRMYFPQEIVEKDGENYYKTFNGLRKISDVLDLMKNFKSTEKIEEIKMKPVGMYMGNTKCRCCGQNLGNGSGCASFSDNGKKESFSLTGGADHYLSHGINLNLICHLFENKEKKVKVHITFVGDINDIEKINEYMLSLDNFVKPELETTLNSAKKPKMK